MNRFEKINYNSFSSETYLKEHYRPYLKDYEKSAVEKYFQPGMKILDLGCGAGRTTKILKNSGYDVIGVDINEKLINLARKKYGNIDFSIGDACNLGFADSSFDLVFFSFNGIDYIHPHSKRMAALREIGRVLKDGGLLIYSSHNALNIPRTKMSIKTFFRSLITLKIFSSYRLERHEMGDLITYYGSIFSEKKNLVKNYFQLVGLLGVGRFKASQNRLVLSLFSKHITYIARAVKSK